MTRIIDSYDEVSEFKHNDSMMDDENGEKEGDNV